MNIKEIESIRNSYLFKKSNSVWNNYKFNLTYNIGNLIYLYNESQSNTYSDFADWYFNSGEKRLTLINNNTQYLHLLKFRFYDIDYHKIPNISINIYNGRTKQEIDNLSFEFYIKLKKCYPYENFTLDLINKYVYIRLFYETYLGFKRETNTLSRLNELFPKFDFIKSNTTTDVKYSVDIEVFKNDILIGAIQVKSEKFLFRNSYKTKIINAINNSKQQQYSDINNVKVLTVFATENGDILNYSEVCNSLNL